MKRGTGRYMTIESQCLFFFFLRGPDYLQNCSMTKGALTFPPVWLTSPQTTLQCFYLPTGRNTQASYRSLWVSPNGMSHSLAGLFLTEITGSSDLWTPSIPPSEILSCQKFEQHPSETEQTLYNFFRDGFMRPVDVTGKPPPANKFRTDTSVKKVMPTKAEEMRGWLKSTAGL